MQRDHVDMSIRREDKFGYGFLLVGLFMPYLLDKFFGPLAGLLVAVGGTVLGIGFIAWGHLGSEKRASKRSKAIVITLASAAVITILGFSWKVYQRSKNEASTTAGQSVPSAPQQNHLASSAPIEKLTKSNDSTTKPAPRPSSSPVHPRPEKSNSSIVVETAPTFGNLADRANALANEIMLDLVMHGWKDAEYGQQYKGPVLEQMPTNVADARRWNHNRSSSFRFRFLRDVLSIRNEFAQVHLRDEGLDQFLKSEGFVAQPDGQIGALPTAARDYDINSMDIERVAGRLRVLASQIPVQRDPPKPLVFSITRISHHDSELPFEAVITIATNEDIVGGYIALEFDASIGSVSTDLTDARQIGLSGSEGVGNKQLRDFLVTHRNGLESYVVEVGSVPFTSRSPIHVTAKSNAAFNVSRVLFFEK